MAGGKGGRGAKQRSSSRPGNEPVDDANAGDENQNSSDSAEVANSSASDAINSNIPKDADIQDNAYWIKMRELVRNEVSNVLDVRLKNFEERLSKIEKNIQCIAQMKKDITSLEDSMDFHTKELETVRGSTLPTLVAHLNKVVTAISLQNVDLNMHRRKFQLIIHGIKGPAKEDSGSTRKSLLDMATKRLGVDATANDLAACHRLTSSKDSGIIARFIDLSERDKWLAKAKKLQGTNISMSVDVPPCLRKVKKELLEKRKNLSPETKRRSYIKHLPSWPYLELRYPIPKIGGSDPNSVDMVVVPHSFSKASVAQSAADMDEPLEYVIATATTK